MGRTGFGGLVRRLTRQLTGPIEPDTNTEAQIRKDSSKTKDDHIMCANKYPSYFMTVEILREFLNENFGPYDAKIKMVMDYYVFMTPGRPLTESQREDLGRLTDRASQ